MCDSDNTRVKHNKVCIVGLVINHQSLYKFIINLFLSKGYDVMLITRTPLLKSFDSYKHEITIKSFNDKSDFKILRKCKKIINASAVLIIDEIFDHFYKGIGLKLNSKNKFLIVHNPNRWFHITFNFNLRFFDSLFFRNLFLRQFKNYVAISPNVKNYLLLICPWPINIFFLPFDFSIEPKDLIAHDNLIITIPGSVNVNRRFYLPLLEQIKLYYSQNTNSIIRFKFLGKLEKNQKKILDLINEINSQQIRIYFWNHYISDLDFEREMSCTDYLLSNLNVISLKDGRVEIYGQTKESGVTYLSYLWSLPLILPHNQIVFNEINTQLIRFTGPEDFIRIFSLIENLDKNSFRSQALINFKSFNLYIEKEINYFFEAI